MQLRTYAVLTATIFSTACAATTGGGSSGCASYGEARLTMPDPETLADDWLEWMAKTDARMTATCR